MKVCITTYSFYRLLREGSLDLKGIVRKIIDLGVDGIEFTAFDPPAGTDKEEYASELGAMCRSAGLPVVNYAVAADFLNGSGGDLDAEVERASRDLTIAKALGAPLMRHDCAWGPPPGYPGLPSFENMLPRVAEGARRVTVRAAEMGIRTCTENHGYYIQGADRVARLCAAVNHKNYGLLADVGNFICADEDGAVALGQILPMVFHVHVKDMQYRSGNVVSPGRGWGRSRGGGYFKGAILGHGDTPLVPALRILKNGKYDGYISIEYEGGENPDFGVTVSLENIRRYLDIVNAE